MRCLLPDYFFHTPRGTPCGEAFFQTPRAAPWHFLIPTSRPEHGPYAPGGIRSSLRDKKRNNETDLNALPKPQQESSRSSRGVRNTPFSEIRDSRIDGGKRCGLGGVDLSLTGQREVEK